MAELEGTMFHRHLTKSNSKIRESRAQGITSDLYRMYSRKIEDKQYELENIERELLDMLDLHPDTAIGLKLGQDFNAEEFVATRNKLLVRQRMLEVELQVLKRDFQHLFSKTTGDDEPDTDVPIDNIDGDGGGVLNPDQDGVDKDPPVLTTS